jgi:hypothetical protein
MEGWMLVVDTSEIVHVLLPLIEVFDDLQILYYVGGSVVSSVYGEPRGTLDADIVADIHFKHVNSLVRGLQAEYYIDADMIRDAIRHRSSFNIIYLDSMFKIDVFLPKTRQYAQQERLRARKEVIAEGVRPFYLSSPEDIILNKLEWYKMGEQVSTRQWNDLIGVIKRQGATLDLPYLHLWARELRVADLLARALHEGGLEIQAHQETLEILQDDELMADFRQGVQDIEESRVVLWEKVKKELDLE